MSGKEVPDAGRVLDGLGVELGGNYFSLTTMLPQGQTLVDNSALFILGIIIVWLYLFYRFQAPLYAACT